MAQLVATWNTDNSVHSLAISQDGAYLAAGIGIHAFIWDLVTGKKVLGPLGIYRSSVAAIALSPDGRILATGLDDGKMIMWDIKTGKIAHSYVRKMLGRWPPVPTGEIDLENGHISRIILLVFSQDGRLLVSGGCGDAIGLWDTHTWEPADEQLELKYYFTSTALSPDEKTVVVSCNGIIKGYNLATRTLIFEVKGHEEHINSLAFSPDGRRIASASEDCTVRIWDGIAFSPIGGPLKGHTGWVQRVVFSPDGRYIASASDDKTIRIWDADTGVSQGDPLHGHTDIIKTVVFSPDGTRLISGSWDATIKIWDVRGLGIHATTSKKLDSEFDPLDTTITSTTTPAQVIFQLGVRGCPNMTDALDLATCGEYPVSSGGFGDIYRCKLKSGTNLAIKTIRLYVGPDNQINHKVLKPLLGLAMFRNQIGMLTIWEPNGSLPQYLGQNSETDRCALSKQVVEGLSYLHDSGVVHGDLKGANVLISKVGVAQLADFGNASLQESTLEFTKTTSRETLSLRWAAPELLEGARCSFAADIYALGMTILEAISGDVPWSGQSERAVVLAVMLGKTSPERPETHIPMYSEHGDALWSLLVQCWEIEAEKRPNAAQVKTAIAGITREGLKSREVELIDADSN